MKMNSDYKTENLWDYAYITILVDVCIIPFFYDYRLEVIL